MELSKLNRKFALLSSTTLPLFTMNEFTLLIQDWEADIQLLRKHLRRLASPAAPQALAKRRYLQRKLHQARQAQVLLYNLSQAHAGAFSLAV